MSMRIGLTAVLSAIASQVFIASGHAADQSAAPTVVTVVGNVTKTNRPVFNPFRDGFLKFHGKEFGKAFAFSYAALSALPQVNVRANANDWPAPITASGPRLSDVLHTAGVAPDAKLTVMALDGYAVELDAEDRKSEDWILAITMNGKPLAVGGRGPAWLIYDTGGKPVAPDMGSKWVWSLFVIEVE